MVNIESTEVVWLDARADYTLEDLAEQSGFAHEYLRELVECGAIVATPGEGSLHFAAQSIALVRAARRLRDDFELDLSGVTVAITLLRRVGELETEMRLLRAHLPHRRA